MHVSQFHRIPKSHWISHVIDNAFWFAILTFASTVDWHHFEIDKTRMWHCMTYDMCISPHMAEWGKMAAKYAIFRGGNHFESTDGQQHWMMPGPDDGDGDGKSCPLCILLHTRNMIIIRNTASSAIQLRFIEILLVRCVAQSLLHQQNNFALSWKFNKQLWIQDGWCLLHAFIHLVWVCVCIHVCVCCEGLMNFPVLHYVGVDPFVMMQRDFAHILFRRIWPQSNRDSSILRRISHY